MERESFLKAARPGPLEGGSNGSIFRKLAPLTGEGCSAQRPSKGTLPRYLCVSGFYLKDIEKVLCKANVCKNGLPLPLNYNILRT